MQKTRRKHGLSGTTMYHVWTSMKARCYNENSTSYDSYGGRGITVCERWRESVEAFVEDMGARPSPLHTLDRIDNNGNYEPSNCRWATNMEQVNNKRPPCRRTKGVFKKVLNTTLAGEAAHALQQFLAAHRPEVTVNACVRVAVQDFLAARGYWPPAAP